MINNCIFSKENENCVSKKQGRLFHIVHNSQGVKTTHASINWITADMEHMHTIIKSGKSFVITWMNLDYIVEISQIQIESSSWSLS